MLIIDGALNVFYIGLYEDNLPTLPPYGLDRDDCNCNDEEWNSKVLYPMIFAR